MTEEQTAFDQLARQSLQESRIAPEVARNIVGGLGFLWRGCNDRHDLNR